MKIITDDEKANGIVYSAATNPVLAVRLSGGPRFPRPGYPETLRWRKQAPALDIWCLQEEVYDVIKGLPDPLKAVIMARFGEQCTLEVYGERIARTRERVRQLEAKALRTMRQRLECLNTLREATEVVPIPGSSLDPDWVNTKQAVRLTGYSREHIRWLCRNGRIVCQINDFNRKELQISRASLRRYVLAGLNDRRITGQWRANNHEQT